MVWPGVEPTGDGFERSCRTLLEERFQAGGAMSKKWQVWTMDAKDGISNALMLLERNLSPAVLGG